MCVLNIESRSVFAALSLSTHDSITITSLASVFLSLLRLFLQHKSLSLTFLLLYVVQLSYGVGDGAGPSRPATVDEPIALRYTASDISLCVSIISLIGVVLFKLSVSSVVCHAVI